MGGYARTMSDAQSDRSTIAATDCAEVTVLYPFMLFQIVRMLSYKSAMIVKRVRSPFGLGTSAIGSIFFIDGLYLFY